MSRGSRRLAGEAGRHPRKVAAFCQALADLQAGARVPLPELGQAEECARLAWNAMGGRVDWPAVPILIDLYDVIDVEAFLEALFAIRNIQSMDRDDDH